MQPFRLFAATGDAIARLESRDGDSVETTSCLEGSGAQCVAVDPHDPNRVFVGTFDNGVYRTLDGGETWTAVGEAMPELLDTALATAARDQPSRRTHSSEPSELCASFAVLARDLSKSRTSCAAARGLVGPVMAKHCA